ncbi:MAG: alpha-amylase family glycosyl hydrolase [Mariniblastus sp.]|nr:alpha-amylase family glycosyl hydrolase [Mariniblastus sp.]
MADFHQHGVITTLHQLNTRPLETLESELNVLSDKCPIALVLPSLYSELKTDALKGIVDELSKVSYLKQIVIGLDRANEEEYRHALEFFSRLPGNPKILWNDGPRLKAIDNLLESYQLSPNQQGKGRNAWYMFGYVLATGEAQAVALHDCDIKNYSRDLLARLVYPIVSTNLNFKFCKGFYVRTANDVMHGRVCRLLVTPLVRAMETVCGSNNYLKYLDSFRYALAGEFAMTRDVLENIRIPANWGLEMGILSEIHRNYATSQICQVDIADSYEHKHQDLSANDRQAGLSRMSVDIANSLFRKMATQGHVFEKERIRTIKAAYYRIALDLVESYSSDALINGLNYDRHSEIGSIEVFAENIMQAGADFLQKDMDQPFTPSWQRVVSAVPDIFDMITEAVDADAEEFGNHTSNLNTARTASKRLRGHIRLHVAEIYGERQADVLTERLLTETGLKGHKPVVLPLFNKWDERDIALITYGDSIENNDKAPLRALSDFLEKHLRETFSTIHVLPFFPYTSDDGFSISDYTVVNPELGDWQDVEKIGEHFKLMSDLVLNHCSTDHRWFHNFKQQEDPGKDFFIEKTDNFDTSSVVRPRSTPLFTQVKTIDGEKQVWCTFGPDQVDLDFSNPDVLIEIINVLKTYLQHGIRWFRLDAVAFLWKQSGTDCVHQKQTHEIIKLLRLVLETLAEDSVIITETNVPNRENLTYFGNDNEAHLIYNFSLPPLLLYSLLSGNCSCLRTWMGTMPPARQGRTYFNFIASHDGIGMRPTEGLLTEEEKEKLLDTMRSFGGCISNRRMNDGMEKPYEINISLYDALQGTLLGQADEYQIDRFVCAHTIVLALEGIPGIYIHSMLATENDHELFEKTGQPRSINRHHWQDSVLEQQLGDPETHHYKVFSELKRRIEIRARQKAFHPNATQYTLHFNTSIFAFWRESLCRKQSLFALHNVTNQPQKLPLVELNLIATETWRDVLTGQIIDDLNAVIEIPPYGAVWITNSK